MKALLKYGQFTAMIELPEPMLTVSIMKPLEGLSMIPLESYNADPSQDKPRRLEFRLRKELTDDIYLYEFEGEY